MSTERAQPVPTRFSPRPQLHWLATAAEIEHALSAPGEMTRLLDTRPPEQYVGQAIWTPQGSHWFPPGHDWLEVAPGRLMRGGHIPGAIHLQAARMLDPTDWTYRSSESICDLARAMGLEPGQHIITYCGVGISASLALFALYLAGYRHLALYDASWEEWGTDPTRPVEREGR